MTPEYLKPPRSPEEWFSIANDFEHTWNLPHVIGSIDGKHIRIQRSLTGHLTVIMQREQ